MSQTYTVSASLETHTLLKHTLMHSVPAGLERLEAAEGYPRRTGALRAEDHRESRISGDIAATA